ncbi:sensor histidine kinase [Naumannella huperziae]
MSDTAGWAQVNARRLEFYLRWTMYLTPMTIPLVFFVMGRSAADEPVRGVLALVGSLVVAVVGALVIRRTLAAMRRRSTLRLSWPPDWRLVGWVALGVLASVASAAFIQPLLGAYTLIYAFSCVTPILGFRDVLVASVVTSGLSAAMLMIFPGPGSAGATLGLTILVAAIAPFVLLTFWHTAWMLRVLWELQSARDTAARLAVAEERLRFSRDLHDVFGRTLSTVAVKSELAAGLADRGRGAESAVQMREVHQLVEDAGKEVREVVRGYRRTTLAHELVGARSVLESAGVRAEIAGDPDGLPQPVSEALGWVLRESVTNLLRHATATRVAIRLDHLGDRVRLVITNDGVRESPTDHVGGSGLAGLRERLASVRGELRTRSDDRRFTVQAEVPLADPARGGPGLAAPPAIPGRPGGRERLAR